MTKKVLFICLGNICRSPVAEGVFKKLVKERDVADQFTIESRGTGSWHIGQQAHDISRKVALQYDVDIEGHRAKQLTKKDIEEFDYLLVMDRSNLENTRKIADGEPEFLKLMREYDEHALAHEQDVPDPFYAIGEQGFHEVHEMLVRSCNKLLDEILE